MRLARIRLAPGWALRWVALQLVPLPGLLAGLLAHWPVPWSARWRAAWAARPWLNPSTRQPKRPTGAKTTKASRTTKRAAPMTTTHRRTGWACMAAPAMTASLTRWKAGWLPTGKTAAKVQRCLGTKPALPAAQPGIALPSRPAAMGECRAHQPTRSARATT